MNIFAATLHHKHGVGIFLASSEAGRIAKIADHCRAAWDRTNDENGENSRSCDGVDPIACRVLTDQEVIDIYFAAENMGSHEYVEMYASEDVEGERPAVVVNITGGVMQGASANVPIDVYCLDFDDFEPDAHDVIEVDGDKVILAQLGAEIDPAFVRRVIDAPFVNASEVAA